MAGYEEAHLGHVGMLKERQVSGTLLGVDKGVGEWDATFELDDGELLVVGVSHPVGKWLLQMQGDGWVEFSLKLKNGVVTIFITDDD